MKKIDENTDKKKQSLHEKMQALRQSLANNPAEAKAFLEKTGIFTKSGKLTKHYQ